MSVAPEVPAAALGPDELLALARDVTDRAVPGEQVEAYVAHRSGMSVRAYGGEIESLTQATSSGVGIRIFRDGRTGFAWAASLEPDILAETLAEARDNLPFAEPDATAALAEPDGVEPVVHDLFRDDVLTMPPAEKVALALELERAARSGHPRVKGVRVAMYGDSAGAFAVATSTGIAASARSTSAYLTVSALADDGDAAVIAGGVSVGRSPADISVAEAAGDAIDRLVSKFGAAKPRSAELTLVLEPRMTATVIGIISGMLNGESVAKGRSPFAERLGEHVASPLLTVVDDPTNPESFGAESHDDEGLACRPVTLLDGGVLQGFLHNTSSARRIGAVSTASAARGYASRPGISARALTISAGEGDLDSLLSGVGDGLLVTAMNGLHSGVNPVSGDFSVGVEGIRIRGGERAEPVKEATVASTLQRLLLDVSHVGADVEWQPGGTGGVTLVIPGVTMSGR